MKIVNLGYLLWISVLLPFYGNAQRIVGYIEGTTPVATLTSLEYDKATDIIFGFINPNSGLTSLQTDITGDVNSDFQMEIFQIIKSKCYPMVENGPKLWIAIGGAGNTRASRLANLCSTSGGRSNLASWLVSFAVTHELYGIDIDWEFPGNPEISGSDVSNYGSFINTLRSTINSSSNTSLKISVAVGGETGGCAAHISYFPNSATVVGNIDYFNMMTYDLPHTNHSALADANTAFNGWNSCRGIPKSKMVMGIPFYGKTDNSSYTGTALNFGSVSSGNFPSAYNNDNTTVSGSTYYYDGGTSGSTNGIPNKIDAVRTTHDANGIFIWKLEQDQIANSYSLLRASNTKMFGEASVNPCSTRPYLGKDTTMCTGQTLTLDPGVPASSAAGARTFSWTKDGSLIGGNTSTLSITQAGTYIVTVTQTYGGSHNCSLTDEIVVTEQANVSSPSASPDIVCASGTAASTLSSSSTGTIEWYTSATGGASIATGANTSVSPTVTTTYYAQATSGSSNKRYFAGRGAILSSNVWNERTGNPTMTSRPEWVQKLTVLQPMTIKTVVVYFHATDNITGAQIMILDATQAATATPEATVNISSISAHSGGQLWGVYPNIITVNTTLQPGTYYVGVYNANGHGSAPVSQGAGLEISTSQASAVAGIYSIEANAYQNNGSGYSSPSAHYGQIFDWRIETAAPSQCGRKPVTVTYDCTAPVELITFSGSNKYGKNYLHWQTAMERNNDFFAVERSIDGLNYSEIGKVKGVDDSKALLNYSFIDQDPGEGNNYYRLVQYDKDGTVNYSKSIVVNYEFISNYLISPNPFEDAINIQSNSPVSERYIQVTTLEGTEVHSQSVLLEEDKILKIGKDFNPGVYILKIQDGQTLNTYKIVKK